MSYKRVTQEERRSLLSGKSLKSIAASGFDWPHPAVKTQPVYATAKRICES